MSSTELVQIKKQVECLIEFGIVRPRKSPLASPRIIRDRKRWELKVLC